VRGTGFVVLRLAALIPAIRHASLLLNPCFTSGKRPVRVPAPVARLNHAWPDGVRFGIPHGSRQHQEESRTLNTLSTARRTTAAALAICGPLLLAGCFPDREPDVKFKDYVGQSVGKARDGISADLNAPTVYRAIAGEGYPGETWKVCFQSPEAGTMVDPDDVSYDTSLSAVPPGTTCPATDAHEPVTMPKLTGGTYGKAVAEFKAAGLTVTAVKAYKDETREPGGSWKVCKQDPAAGWDPPANKAGSLTVVRPGDACPDWYETYRDAAKNPRTPPPGIHVGKLCRGPGNEATTEDGTAVECMRSPDDDRFRWQE
jgi:hypothetical protein